MPVTAKLSRKFYERLGDDIVTELVDWFNAVDSTYQTQLREINDLNWERFKSDMGAMRVEWRAEIATTRAELRAEIATLGAELRKEMAELAGALRAEMAALRAEMIKWMFIFWCGQMIGLGGLIVGLLLRAALKSKVGANARLHFLGSPEGSPDKIHHDILNARESADFFFRIGHDLWPTWTTRRSEGHVDFHRRAIDSDVIHEAEIHDVEVELRIFYAPQSESDLVFAYDRIGRGGCIVGHEWNLIGKARFLVPDGDTRYPMSENNLDSRLCLLGHRVPGIAIGYQEPRTIS